jgi:hypothetical protein
MYELKNLHSYIHTHYYGKARNLWKSIAQVHASTLVCASVGYLDMQQRNI